MSVGIIFFKKGFHLMMDIFRFRSIATSNFVRQFFIVTDSEPDLPFIGCSGFQQIMKAFDICFGKFAVSLIDDIVNGAEMVCCLDDVIDVNRIVSDSYCVCLKYISGLVMGQTTALYMVRVVCQINLDAMIYAAFYLTRFLFS